MTWKADEVGLGEAFLDRLWHKPALADQGRPWTSNCKMQRTMRQRNPARAMDREGKGGLSTFIILDQLEWKVFKLYCTYTYFALIIENDDLSSRRPNIIQAAAFF
jgi:hypothetical protein